MTYILAFAGKKQSGKTTCAKFLADYCNNNSIYPYGNARIYNFADTLKQDICMNILGLTYGQCYGSDAEKNTITDIEWNDQKLSAREVMQIVGTDIFRKMKNNVWVESTIKKIAMDQPRLALIADCRFPNEVEQIKKNHGIVIRLTRSLYESDHLSETALDNYSNSNFDIVIDNQDLSIDEQHSQILDFLVSKDILPL